MVDESPLPEQEPKYKILRRLEQEGRDAAFNARKLAIRREQKCDKDTAFYLAAAEFPPLAAAGPLVDDLDADPLPDLEFAPVTPDMKEVVEWVAGAFAMYDEAVENKNAKRAKEILQSAPSGMAASYLKWAQESGRTKFFGDVVAKFIGKPDTAERKVFEDDKRSKLGMIDEIAAYHAERKKVQA